MVKNIPFERSFASYSKSQFWNYNKNILKPIQVFKSSAKKYWFSCIKCNHSFLFK